MSRIDFVGRPLTLLCLLLNCALPALAGNEAPARPKAPPSWGYTVNGGCECSQGRYCTGPKGGRYCLKNSRKQYL